MAGNTEQGKCRQTNKYLFFLVLIGHWYNENFFILNETTFSSRYSFLAWNSWFAKYSLKMGSTPLSKNVGQASLCLLVSCLN